MKQVVRQGHVGGQLVSFGGASSYNNFVEPIFLATIINFQAFFFWVEGGGFPGPP